VKRLILLLAALVTVLSVFSLTLADDEFATCIDAAAAEGSSLPVCGTRADNECYAGGRMEGKCTNDWEWKAGWYIARFNDGSLKREEVPDEYQFLLPPPVEVLPPAGGGAPPRITTICHFYAGYDGLYCASSDGTGTVDFGNNSTIDNNALFFSTSAALPGNCVSSVYSVGSNWLTWGFSTAEFTSLGLDPTGIYCWIG
jgi:hypothetical protein